MLDLDQVQTTGSHARAGTPVPFARISAFAPFLDFLHAIGAPTDQLLHRAHVPAATLNDAEGLISIASIYHFLELAAQREHLEDLGTIVGRNVSAFDMGAFGKALQCVSTVHDYLQTGISLIGTLSGGTHLWLSTEGNVLRVNQHLSGPPGLGRCIADVYTLVSIISMLRRFIGTAWSPGEVRLMSGDEALLGDQADLGNASLIPGQRHSSFTVSQSLLNLPVRCGRADKALSKKDWSGMGRSMPDDLKSAIQQLIDSLLPEGYLSIRTVAEAAGMSPRTFQRRLADAGMSYAELVAASRVRQARDLLISSEMPVAGIADLLGYSDPSNFARAFRRQTGMSPVAYRRILATD
jgi:AraC-like DNA-binding protein